MPVVDTPNYHLLTRGSVTGPLALARAHAVADRVHHREARAGGAPVEQAVTTAWLSRTKNGKCSITSARRVQARSARS